MKKMTAWLLAILCALALPALGFAEDRAMEGNMYLTGLPIVKETVQLRAVIVKPDNVYKEVEDLGSVKLWEDDTNIDFVIEQLTPDNKTEKANLMVATMNLPDVFFPYTAPNIVRNGADGIYIAVEDLIATYCPNITAIFEERPDIRNVAYTPDGHIYAFPTLVETGVHQNRGMYVHMDWLADTGLDLPGTTDEFTALLRTFKGVDLNGNGKQDEYPMGFCVKETASAVADICLWFGMPDYSLSYVSEDGKIECGFTTEGYRQGIEYLRMLYEEGLVDPEIYTHDTQTYRAKVGEYKYGVFELFAPYNVFGNEANQEDYRYELLEPICGPEGTTGWDFGVASANNNGLVITSACEIPEVAARYVDYCADTLISLQMYQGLLGQNLLDNGDGTYSAPAVLQDHEIVGSYGYSIITKERFALIEPTFFDTQRVPRAEMYRGIVNFDAKFPTMQSSVEESEELALYQTDLQSYVDQTQARWVTEGGIETEWDAYVGQLEKMGLNEFLAIRQAQYERYLTF